MPPKVQIPKEHILETALQLVIREGPDAVSIKRMAKELGSSTQPISWTFGNMEGFRCELAAYALRYFNGKVSSNTGAGQNPAAGFAVVGESYLQIAFEEPNLIHFVRANSRRIVERGGMGYVFDPEKSRELRMALMGYLGINEEATATFMQTVVIYTQGLVSMVVDGTIPVSFEEAVRMMRETGIAYLIYAGVPEEKARAIFAPNEKPHECGQDMDPCD